MRRERRIAPPTRASLPERPPPQGLWPQQCPAPPLITHSATAPKPQNGCEEHRKQGSMNKPGSRIQLGWQRTFHFLRSVQVALAIATKFHCLPNLSKPPMLPSVLNLTKSTRY